MDLRVTMRQRLVKPHYLFRPHQAGRRIVQSLDRRPVPASAESQLPWGLPISYDPSEFVGSSIRRTGVFELAVTEALFRLADPGELAVDVGGNIGYMSSVLAVAVGPGGRVITYEPHPVVFASLSHNADRWPVVDPREKALSDQSGFGVLSEPDSFQDNQGTATVVTSGDGIRVKLARLDDEFPDQDIGVMKLDAEGSEAAVLRGAERILEAQRVRDVVFEEHEPLPTAASSLLTESGYTIMRVYQRATGLGVTDGAPPRGAGWDAPTYVATRDAGRAVQRLSTRGWRALRPRHSQ